ncbi:GNAT family acetyltransferase [Pedobacter psychrophilus]|uniref:GNAT family acetyltransferase n=1 Tax=Pedobacter psychrophilus TaxID=1826909 RepID=A0A179DAK1_9SPHI|nr:GNAT family N-acetyltransferase [Pedobacter psychrophilus]OAQ38076.1 GNAT family acetyltransferase [Pedobacter psychrophilus]
MKTIINEAVYLRKGYKIDTDKSLLNLDYIYNFLTQKSYWAKGLPRKNFETSINESICFGVYFKEKQIGFARVISDKSTFAYLADVFIDKEYRGLGLSKWLLQTIINYKDFDGIRRFLLATADAHQLYQKFGFEPLNKPDRFLEKYRSWET